MAQIELRYANALLELSIENEALEADLNEAQIVRNAFDDADVQAYFFHPHISDVAKNELLNKTFSSILNDRLSGFLKLLIDKNREPLLLEILDAYITQAKQQLGRIEAKVVSATKLSDLQVDALNTRITSLFNKKIELINVLDPDVIGGFYILVDGYVFDATIRTELHKMKEQLKKGGTYAS